jgi:hypothetical protein
MRRSLFTLVLTLGSCLLLATPAAALTGSGTWNHVGTNGLTPPGPALNGHVYEMYATPSLLYVAGGFTNAGGIAAADRIATWNGSSWGSLGNVSLAGTGSVFAIAVSGGKVYAGGNFTNAGGNDTADYLAVYDGVSWKPFCNASSTVPAFNGPSFQVLALQVIDSILYVGGTFNNANGVGVADYLIGCNMTTGAMTTTTTPGGQDVTGAIYDLAATTDGTLYAGGTFTDLDDVPAADRLASYDGTWHGVGTTVMTGLIRGLFAKGMDLYISRDDINIGGDALADHLVRWNGSTISHVGSNSTGLDGYFPASSQINELASVGSLLFAAGSWLDANGAATGDMLAYFDGVAWHPLGSNGAGNGALNANTEGLAVYGGQLYAGGASTSAGSDPLANFVASRSLRLPDNTIAASTGASVGTNIYNGTAAGQTKSLSANRGTSKTFRVVVWNQGILPATFTLKGTNAGTGYTVKYVEDWSGTHQNITAAVKAGTYVTPQVAPTTGYQMIVTVTLSNSAANKGSFVVTASSTAGTPKDSVKGVVNAN